MVFYGVAWLVFEAPKQGKAARNKDNSFLWDEPGPLSSCVRLLMIARLGQSQAELDFSGTVSHMCLMQGNNLIAKLLFGAFFRYSYISYVNMFCTFIGVGYNNKMPYHAECNHFQSPHQQKTPTENNCSETPHQ